MSRLGELFSGLMPEGVPHLQLSEISTIFRGKRFVKADFRETGSPCIHYGEIYTYYGTVAYQARSFLDASQAAKLRTAQRGDVIVASAGESIEDIGKAVAWLGDTDVVVHDACYVIRHDMDPTFLAYVLRSQATKRQLRNRVSTSKISSISVSNLGQIRIPVPPLEVQREIVRILDRFTELEAELEAALEAELAARRKQYEHYRDELLTFKELPACDLSRVFRTPELGR